MNRLLVVATVVSLVTMAPGAVIDRAGAAGDAPDAKLWDAAGVTQLTERTEAPSFALTDLTGQEIDLQDLRGRLVMLYFWATW
jgi:hypothetical protein